MLNLKRRWDQKRQAAALRALRSDPHLAKDIGLTPIKRGQSIDKTLW